MSKTTAYQIIHARPGLRVAARPALGRWVVRWRWSTGLADRYGVWLPTQRWNLREWQPTMGFLVPLEAVNAVEAWLRAHPMPAFGTAGVKP
jgi:hypothetical protein